MALIKCPECNTDVSDKADVCPKCAYPLKGTTNPLRKKVVFALLIELSALFVVFLGVLIAALSGMASKSTGFGIVVMFCGFVLVVIGAIKLFRTKIKK